MKDVLPFETEKKTEEIKAFLAKGLADKPTADARRLLPAERPRRRFRIKTAGLVAAGLVCILLLAGIPAVAQAVSGLPFIGKVYMEFLKGTGMDLAYKAGFVTELDRKVTARGITLTVFGAYGDKTKTVIFFKLDADKDARSRFEEIRREAPSLELEAGAMGRFLPDSWTTYYDEEEQVIYGLATARPLSWLSFNNLKITLSHEEDAWEVTFPVQQISASQIDTVKIGKSFTYKGKEYTVVDIVFTPAQTVVNYTVRGGDNAQGSSSSGVSSSAGSVGNVHQSPTWKLVTADGEEPACLGGGVSSLDPGSQQREVSFMPTDSRDVTVVFMGYETMRFGETAVLPLAVGEKYKFPEGVLEITGIETKGELTRVKVQMEGNQITKADAELLQPSGQRLVVQGTLVHGHSTELIFPGIWEEGALLEIEAIAVNENIEIPVK